jgi:AcrR family transcriptional regulator
MSMESEKKSSVLGRPREFDTDAALESAMRVFWRKGYEGTSLSDLTDAMGINRPSLYAAFGNKEAVFRKALDRYTSGPAAYVCAALEAPTAREVAERLLGGTISALTDSSHPSGCMMVQAALVCGEEADPIRLELCSRRAEADALLCRRLERAVTEGDLPADTDYATLARYLSTVIRGLGVQAAGGANREELWAVAHLALQVWPGER